MISPESQIQPKKQYWPFYLNVAIFILYTLAPFAGIRFWYYIGDPVAATLTSIVHGVSLLVMSFIFVFVSQLRPYARSLALAGVFILLVGVGVCAAILYAVLRSI